MTTIPTPDSSKLLLLRKKLHEQRASLPNKRQADIAICAHLKTWFEHYLMTSPIEPLQLAAYWPIRDEPNIVPWLTLTEANPQIHISLPCIVEKNKALIFRQWSSSHPMQPGLYAIPEPQGIIVIPKLLLVPTLGFTHQGDRLGYGGGYYDRTLEQLRQHNPELQTIGITYASSALEQLDYRAAEHDQPLDWIIHEQGIIQVSPDSSLKD